MQSQQKRGALRSRLISGLVWSKTQIFELNFNKTMARARQRFMRVSMNLSRVEPSFTFEQRVSRDFDSHFLHFPTRRRSRKRSRFVRFVFSPLSDRKRRGRRESIVSFIIHVDNYRKIYGKSHVSFLLKDDETFEIKIRYSRLCRLRFLFIGFASFIDDTRNLLRSKKVSILKKKKNSKSYSSLTFLIFVHFNPLTIPCPYSLHDGRHTR